MQWTFSLPWFFGGIAIAAAGALIVKFHRQIADTWANGVSSYDHVKLFGLVACIAGLIFMANLHTMIFYLIFHIIMPDKFP
jgi:hypothetical protein